MSDVSVRTGTVDEHAAVASVLDGAMLATEGLAAALDDERVLVAVADERVLGALVFTTPRPRGRAGVRAHVEDDLGVENAERAHVDAIAVRRSRRGQCIGSALVGALLADVGVVTAEFDAGVRPFYESLGFTVEPLDDGRFLGTYRPEER